MAAETTAPTEQEATAVAEPEPERRHGALVTSSRGQTVLHASAAELLALVAALVADGFGTCIDVCAVDYLSHPGRTDLPPGAPAERFEVVYNFLCHERAERIRVRVPVPVGEPTVPSLFDLFPGTEAMEREAFDLYGIAFDGHPDLSRILMPEDWEGHPLRKDYAVGRIPVQFKAG